MVNLLTLSFAAMALTPLAGAVPTTRDVASAPVPFSFAKWVDEIIAKPEEAATPQQALDAYYAYVNSTSTDNGEYCTESLRSKSILRRECGQ